MDRKMFVTCAIGAAGAGLTTWAPLDAQIDAQAAVTFRTVALTGDAAPGTEPGVVYDFLRAPVLNGAGQTAFRAFLTGPGVDRSNGQGIWSEGGDSLHLVALAGESAPGTGVGVVYHDFTEPVFNGAGQTAFVGTLTGPDVDHTQRGIWSEGAGSLSLVVREGDEAPGAGAGVVYSDNYLTVRVGSAFGGPLLNGAGQIVFWGRLAGEGVDKTNNEGIWSRDNGSLKLVARAGDIAPDTEEGLVFSDFSDLMLNGAGQIAFLGYFNDPGVDSTYFRGIYLGGSGSLGLIAREGAAAAGTGEGVVFSGFLHPAINDAGQTAFYGLLTGPGVKLTNNLGIWSGGSGSLNLVARRGGAAPGTEPGVVYDGLGYPVINGAGHTAFGASLRGPGVDDTNSLGLWSEGGGSLNLVARIGDAAPGTGPGAVFSNLSNLTRPALNGAGQTAFFGHLTGQGVDDTNNEGIWATDSDGVLTLIVRAGDLFDVNDDPLIDDLRTIRSVSLVTGSGGEDGRGTGFNDAGQLAFRLEFTDDSEGIFVATIH